MQSKSSCALHFSSVRSIHLWSFMFIPLIVFKLWSRCLDGHQTKHLGAKNSELSLCWNTALCAIKISQIYICTIWSRRLLSQVKSLMGVTISCSFLNKGLFSCWKMLNIKDSYATLQCNPENFPSNKSMFCLQFNKCT